MPNIFQKIFLSNAQLNQLNKKQEIIEFISNHPVMHRCYAYGPSKVIRHFMSTDGVRSIITERTYEKLPSEDYRISYSLQILDSMRTTYATHSEVDKIAKKAYKKMKKIWENKKQNVR